MKHPDQSTLALHAGGDLGWFGAWRTARHVARCESCRDEIAVFQDMREALPALNEIPERAWSRIAGEMRANIRLGLAAGECVRETAAPEYRPPLFGAARVVVALGGVLALLVTAVVMERPTPPVMSAAVPLVQTTADGIQRRAGDRGFALMHKDASDVNYTVGVQGTMGASYVDPNTGYITMTKVYVE